MDLVALTGDSSDRLQSVEEMPVEFMEFDDDGHLLVPLRVLRIPQGHLTPPPAPGAATATSAGERESSKKPVVRRAPKQFTPNAASTPRRQSLGCASRGFGMLRIRRANDARWRRGCCPFWDAQRCRGGARLEARYLQEELVGFDDFRHSLWRSPRINSSHPRSLEELLRLLQ